MPPLVQTQKSIVVHCANCGHYRSRHTKEIGCELCIAAIGNPDAARLFRLPIPKKVCRELFTLRISAREIAQARAVSKDTYHGQAYCATCLEIWWAHDGMLCPNGETLFVPLIGQA